MLLFAGSRAMACPADEPPIETGTVGTNLFSKDLLVKIKYPSASTGSASSTSTDDQSYTYDNLGEEAN